MGGSWSPKDSRAEEQDPQSTLCLHVALVLPHSLAQSVNAPGDHARDLPVSVPRSDLMLHPGSAASSWPGGCAAAERNLGLKPTNQTGEGRSQTPLFPGDHNPAEKLNTHQKTNEITQLLTSLCPLHSSARPAGSHQPGPNPSDALRRGEMDHSGAKTISGTAKSWWE